MFNFGVVFVFQWDTSALTVSLPVKARSPQQKKARIRFQADSKPSTASKSSAPVELPALQ